MFSRREERHGTSTGQRDENAGEERRGILVARHQVRLGQQPGVPALLLRIEKSQQVVCPEVGKEGAEACIGGQAYPTFVIEHIIRSKDARAATRPLIAPES